MGKERTDAHGVVSREGCDHILFVGFNGAGKSTVARNLGAMFHRPHVDLDRLVERRCHRSIAEIWHDQGEAAWHAAEHEALESLRRERSLLVAVGSGAVETAANRHVMEALGHIIYLEGTLEDSLSQIRCLARRPELGSTRQARAAYERRRPLYEAMADYTVRITGKTFREVAEECGALLWEEGLI